MLSLNKFKKEILKKREKIKRDKCGKKINISKDAFVATWTDNKIFHVKCLKRE